MIYVLILNSNIWFIESNMLSVGSNIDIFHLCIFEFDFFTFNS